jgi:L-threonylcarbamoyladenylate synthase
VSQIDGAIQAIRQGGLAIIPTDTVYGLVCTPYREDPVRKLSEVKRRSADQPIAIVGASVDWVLECIPELRGRAALAARALLPGPFTLVLSNPARRFPWLSAGRPDTVGIRVPELTGPARSILDAVGAVAATSANLHGEPSPRRLEEVPAAIRADAVLVDGGELPGLPSTVVDLTTPEPRVLREGAIPASEALERVEAALLAFGRWE